MSTPASADTTRSIRSSDETTADGQRRLEQVMASGLLDSPPQREFDVLVALAAECTGCPIALVTVLDDRRQWFKAAVGTDLRETPVEWSFCAHAIASPGELMIVDNATEDDRVCGSPLVCDQPGIRAYMGMPLCADDGTAFGTLCVIDLSPRGFSAQQQAALRRLAVLGEHLINSAVRAARAVVDARAASQSELQRMVMMLTYGIDLKAYVGRDGRYQYINRAFVEMFGRPERDIVGRHIAELVGEGAYRTAVGPRFERALQGEVVHYLRLVDYPASGPRWMEVSLFPAQHEDGRVSGVVVRARDVHDLVLANQRLKDRTVSQEQFVAVLAHDVREPLRTIRSFIHLAIEEAEDRLPPESLAYLNIASRGTDRLSALVNGLLHFLKADGQAIPLEPTRLGPVLSDVLDDLRHLFEATHAHISGSLDGTVMGNHVWLRLCLQNLITNAIKFSRPGVDPVVTLSQRAVPAAVQIRVTDNGIGIPTESIERVFEPFVRLPTPTGVEGAGLGLSLCRRIAALHGGSLQVECSSPEGTTFLLTLPEAHRPAD